MTKEVVTISKFDLLSAIAPADDYGYGKALPTLVLWHGPISTQEIADYSNSFLAREDCTQKDVDNISDKLIDYFFRYGSFSDA